MNKKSCIADLAELERPALEALLAAQGVERFRARQIFGWIYRRGISDVDAMTDLPRDLRAVLARDFTLTTPAVVRRERSIDGTEKFLLRLPDGRLLVHLSLTRAATCGISILSHLPDPPAHARM